ncbi:LuxR family transcriptional regulator [Candidatus Williamhamiltonella defendens]|nr:LuxR family transcriptional regulator [Candidatus Hamiltonella defensa]AYB48606.1 LuxR family transcriptional regulator [Candidatus Hamiltonella defensa]
MFFNNGTINNAIKNYLDNELKKYGNIKYAYVILNKKNITEISIITSHPIWFECYIQNKYQNIDPIIIMSLNRITSFSWDENIMINLNLKLSKIFTMSKPYNITHGYTFIVHDHKNNLALLSMMADQAYIEAFNELIISNKDKLQTLLITVHDKILFLYKEMDIKHHKREDKEMFSTRENEILYWSSVGKTYEEIAMILGIKLGTVKFHMGNVVKKLGVINGKHAIRLGVELKLIKPVFSDTKT